MNRAYLFLAALTLAPMPALAHGAVGSNGSNWTLDPSLSLSLGILAALYATGARKLWSRRQSHTPSWAPRYWYFALGWISLAAATVSPLHQLGARSFSAHMIEHKLLMLVAAPLLVLSHPLATSLWALSKPTRKAIGAFRNLSWMRGLSTFLFAPVPATLLQAAALWIWHAPSLFDLALGREGWHVAQHLSLFFSSLIFWHAMFSYRRPEGLGLAAICLFATSIVAGALGALMSFSDSPWYARYALLGMTPFGMTPTEDQQLAGLLMWIPGGLVHAGAALVMLGKMLRSHSPAQKGLPSMLTRLSPRAGK